MPSLSSINRCCIPIHTMFPDADSNSLTVPYSDQFLLYSNLLDDNNHNPCSPFSFFDQNITHPLFSPSDEQQLELQNSPLVQHQEQQQQPMLTAFEEFSMADTSSNNSNSMGGYCTTTENFYHKALANDPADRISATAIDHIKIDKVSKNVTLSKKDRHSKINTAQGPRDRRMRLSLDIAKRFFGLQDMLGFDKASKTVDWLLSKSQSEINKVAKNRKTHDGNIVAAKSDSFGACEEVSEVVNKDDVSHSGEMDTNKVNKKSSSKMKKIGKVSMSSLRNGFSNLSKDSREKARARARKRTKEKMMIYTLQNQNKQQLDENVNHFSNMDQNMPNLVKKPNFLNLGSHAYLYVDQGHALTNQDESLGSTSYWNPSSCNFNNLQQQICEISHQLPSEDYQFYAKPWETYN